MDYHHVQRGYLPAFYAAFSVVILGVILPLPDSGVVALVVAAILGVVFVIIWVFSQLTVTVGGGEVRAFFRWGWPQRTISLTEVHAVRQLRNHWFWGWGFRWIPRGWMFNVWGLDAVELQLTSGRVFRIGTDEPAELLAALRAQSA